MGLAAIGIVLGAWEAKHCAAIRFGYAAGYAYATAVILAVGLCVTGLLLVIYWRTRGIGAGLVAAGLLGCVTFYGGMAVLLRLDSVAWRYEPPPVAIGPDQRASLVIYFLHGTAEPQIEEFRSSVLTDTAGQMPSFVRGYLRLLPRQANGHDGVALMFSEAAGPEQVAKYVDKIKRDSRVASVYVDVAPNAIRPQPNDGADAPRPQSRARGGGPH